jgi:hypothetical protein
MLLIWSEFSCVCHLATAEVDGEHQIIACVVAACEQFDV